MDDYAGSIGTTAVLGIDGSITGDIETTDDADWFRVSLVAGTTYRFDLEGSATGQGCVSSQLGPRTRIPAKLANMEWFSRLLSGLARLSAFVPEVRRGTMPPGASATAV
jgi:hypothetical protein